MLRHGYSNKINQEKSNRGSKSGQSGEKLSPVGVRIFLELGLLQVVHVIAIMWTKPVGERDGIECLNCTSYCL